jgi:hypothetical protein
MATPVIAALPIAPTRGDGPDNYMVKADVFTAALPPFSIQVNTAVSWMADTIAATQGYKNAAAASATAADASYASAAAQVPLAAAQVALATTQANNAATSATAAQVAAAAAGAAAGLPTLMGKAKQVLTVKADETGVEWKASGQVIGDILFSASVPAANYLQTRSIYSQSSYPALFAKLGTSVNLELSDIQIKSTSWFSINIVYGNGKFVACDNSANIRYSADGLTWTAVASPPWGSGSIFAISFANGKFFVFPTSTTVQYSSTDGITWTAFTIDSSTTHQWIGIFYAYGMYMAFASGDTYYATSTNGTTWTSRALPVNTGWTTFVLGTSLGILFSQSGNYLTTTDGLTWVARTLVFAGNGGRNTAVFANGSFYLTVSVGSGGGFIIKSDDGINWQIISLPESDSWVRILFVAGKLIVFTGQTGLVAISQDGINWIRKSSIWQATASGLVSNGTIIIVFSNSVVTQGYWPIYSYDPAAQFATPAIPTPPGVKAYIKYQE